MICHELYLMSMDFLPLERRFFNEDIEIDDRTRAILYFIQETFLGRNYQAPDFFQDFDQEIPCLKCSKTFQFMHPSSRKDSWWCGMCYVQNNCEVLLDVENRSLLIKDRNGILFHRFPQVQKSLRSTTEKERLIESVEESTAVALEN